MACPIVTSEYDEIKEGAIVRFYQAVGQDHGLFIVSYGSSFPVYTYLVVKKGTKNSSWKVGSIATLSFDATELPPAVSEINEGGDCVPSDAELSLQSKRGGAYNPLLVQDCCHNGISDQTIKDSGGNAYNFRLLMSTKPGKLQQGVFYDATVKTSGGKYDGWKLSNTSVTARSDYLGVTSLSAPSSDRNVVSIRFGDGATGDVKSNTDYHMWVKTQSGALSLLSENSANHSIGFNQSKGALRLRISSYQGGTACGRSTALAVKSSKSYSTFPQTSLDAKFGSLICCAEAARAFWSRQQLHSDTRATEATPAAQFVMIFTLVALLFLALAVLAKKYNK